jgi:hypothetical protein
LYILFQYRLTFIIRAKYRHGLERQSKTVYNTFVFDEKITKQIQIELENAETSRTLGLEGRARVCARRAAGMAVRAYFFAQRDVPAAGDTNRLLAQFLEMDSIPAEIRLAAQHLIQRVDQNYSVPGDIDLLADASTLINFLQTQQ